MVRSLKGTIVSAFERLALFVVEDPSKNLLKTS